MGIFSIFRHFSKERKTEDKQRADRIGDKADPWPIPMLILNKGEMKSFQRYLVFFPTR